MRLALMGFIQVFLVTLQTLSIMHIFYIGIFLFGFTINLFWTFNVQKIAFGRLRDQFLYALGAALGGVFGVFISKIFIFEK